MYAGRTSDGQAVDLISVFEAVGSVSAGKISQQRLAEMALSRQFPSSIPRAGEETAFDELPADEEEEEADVETVDVTSTPRLSEEELAQRAQRRAESQRQMARAAVGGINA